MNRDNIQKMIDFFSKMDNGPDAECGFDMNQFSPKAHTGHPCGSAVCIGGWIKLLNTQYESKSIEDATALYFGISDEDAYDLCFPDCVRVAYEYAEPSDAVALLQVLLDTGEVDWETVMEVKYQ